MLTPEQKEANRRLTEQAMAAKHARDTKQTPNGKETKEEVTPEPPPAPKPAPEKKKYVNPYYGKPVPDDL